MSKQLNILLGSQLDTKASVAQINRQVKEMEKQIQPMRINTDSAKKTATGMNQATKSVKSLNTEMTKTNGLFYEFGVAIKRIPVWMAGMTAFYAPLRSMQAGIQNIIDLNHEMIQLSKVTGETNVALERMTATSLSLAAEMGKTAKEVMNATVAFARLGYELDVANELAQEAILLDIVGNFNNIELATTSLISIMKAFNIEAENTRTAIDSINNVGNNFAISQQDIAEILRRSSSAMQAAGNDLNQIIAMGVGSQEVVQNAEQVGTALRTLSARIRGVSEDGEDLTGLVPQLERQFNSLGLTLMKDENTFLSTYEILKQIASVADDITDIELANLVESVAGKRQANVLLAMIGNWESVEAALKTAENSMGSAEQEFERATEAISFKLNALGAEMTQFWSQVIDSDTIHMFVDSAHMMASLLVTISSRVDLLKVAIAGLTGALIYYNVQKALALTFFITPSMLLSVKTYTGLIAMLGKAITGVTVSLGLAKIALFGIAGGALVALTVGISRVVTYTSRLKRETRELVDTYEDTVREANRNLDTLKALTSEYDELSKKSILTNEEQQRFVDIQNQIADIVPDVVTRYDSQGNAIIDLTEGYAGLEKAILSVIDAEEKALVADAPKIFRTMSDGIKDVVNEIAETEEKLRKLEAGEFVPGISQIGEDRIGSTQQKLVALRRELESMPIPREISMTVDAFINQNEAVKDLSGNQEELLRQYMNMPEILVDFITGQKDVNETIVEFSELISSDDVDKYIKQIDDLNKKQKDGVLSADEYRDAFAGIVAELDSLGILTENQIKILMNLYDATTQGADATSVLAKENAHLSKTFEDATDSIQKYNRMLYDMAEAGQVTGEIKNDIIRNYPHLIAYMHDEAELSRAIQREIELEGQVQRQLYLDKIMYLENFLDARIDGERSLREQLEKAYRVDLQNVANLASAKAKIENELINRLSKAWSSYYGMQAGAIDPVQKQFLRSQSQLGDQSAQQILKEQRMFEMMQKNFDRNFTNMIDSNFVVPELNKVNNALGNFEKSAKSSGSTATKSTKEYYQEIDLMSKKVDIATKKIEDLNNKLQETYENEKRRAILNEIIDLERDRAIILKQSMNQYKTMADQALSQIPEDMQKLVRAGSISPATLKITSEAYGEQAEKIYDLIQQYDAWSDSARALEVELSTINKTLRDMEIEKFNNLFINTNRTLERLEHQFEMANSGAKDFLESSKLLDEIISTLETDLELTKNELRSLNEQYREGTIATATYIELSDVVAKKQQELENSLNRYNNTQQQVQQDRIKALEQVEAKVIEMIRKRVEIQKSALDEELKAFEDYVNDRIKMLDDQYDEEDFLKEMQKEREKAREIQAKINELELDDSQESYMRRQELRKQLTSQEERIEQLSTNRTRDIRRKNLQQQIADERERVNDKKAELDKELENDRLYSEARQAILNGEIRNAEGQMVKLSDAYRQFEDTFGKGMSILGDQIKSEFIKNIDVAIDKLHELERVSAGGTGATTGSKPTQPSKDNTFAQQEQDRELIGRLQSEYMRFVESQSADVIAREQKPGGRLDNMHQQAESLRNKWGWQYQDLRGYIGSYRNGGIIDEDQLAMLHGSNSNWEAVLNQPQLKKLTENTVFDAVRKITTNKMAGLSGSNNIQIGSLLQVTGSINKDVLPVVQSGIDNSIKKLESILRDNGIVR